MKNKELRFIDLFSGLGGFRLALEKYGCRCVFSCDIDDAACKTYELNFKENPKGDITKINEKEVPNHDILCAGFPCQAFSIAGKRLGFEDTRGTLFFDVARILKAKKPLAFFLENVKGLTNHDKGKTLKIILKTLDQIGYNYKFKVVNALDCNVPQNRERWYCVGVRKDSNIDLNKFEFPKKQPLTKTIDTIIVKNLKSNKYKCSNICKKNIQTFIKTKRINVTNRTIAYEIRRSKCQFKNDGISPCLTAKMGTGGNNVPVVVSKMRHLTEKECLKIMGFPDTYKILPGSHAYKQIGNSVAVPVLEIIACELLKFIKEK